MFNLEGSKKLGTDIYVYENFVSKDECSSIIESIESIPEEKWNGMFNEIGQGFEVAYVPLPQIATINSRLVSMLDEGVNLGYSLAPTRMRKGFVGPHHSDNFDFLKTVEASSQLKDGEEFELAENSLAGLIMYFNDFDGGEIYYSNQNITYTPKAGDLVIHSSQVHCKHQVQEVKSDIRYSHSSHLYNVIKVPKGYGADKVSENV